MMRAVLFLFLSLVVVSALITAPRMARRATATAATTTTTWALQMSSLSSSSSTTPPPSYIRWQPTETAWEMQTAVTTFVRSSSSNDDDDDNDNNSVVELHAQLHFGDAGYYEYYNTREFQKNNKIVLYELLTDDNLLQYENTNDGNDNDENTKIRRLVPTSTGQSPVAASPNDEATARQYGWECQVNVVDYSQPNWIHADLTRQEFLQRLDEQQKQKQSKKTRQTTTQSRRQPLWKQANDDDTSTSSITPPVVSLATTALWVGPPLPATTTATTTSTTTTTTTTTTNTAVVSRRLFTNLFLPGSALANVLRAALWVTVPSPELSILLLDWSSLFLTSSSSSSSSGGSSSRRNNNNNQQQQQQQSLGMSPLAVPLWESLAQGRLDRVQQLIFGQVVMTGADAANAVSQQETNTNSLLIAQRNQRALQVLSHVSKGKQQQNKSPFSTTTSTSTTALLYGCSHCPDLHQRLQAQGYTPIQTTWRTAWSVPSKSLANNDNNNNEMTMVGGAGGSMSLIVLLLAYLVISGGDWIATWQSLASGQGDDLLLTAFLYVLRHVMMYIGLSKLLVLDWNNNNME